MSERQFRRVLKGALRDEVVLPTLRGYLYQPKFPSFAVPVQKIKEGKFDGWFHPSTHPLWTERQLWLYLTNPGELVKDPLEFEGALAVTLGNFWHAFVQTCALSMGLLLEVNPKAKTPHDKAEFFVEDRELGTRGWMDGILNPAVLPIEHQEGFELKSMASLKLNKCPKGGAFDPAKLQWFKEKTPQYYAQAQEYLRMSKLNIQRVVLAGMEYPFPMVEIAVPFSYTDSQPIVQKYRKVRQMVADDEIPDPCCVYQSATFHSCPARMVCPISLNVAL